MQIVFYLAEAGEKENEYLAMAKLMIQSVRRTMPQVEVVQMSDMDTPAAVGVDRVDREPLKGPLIYERVRRMANYEGEVLALDPDLIVRQDVSNVFKKTFDVALTIREFRVEVGGVDVTDEQPFNGGVIFCRAPEFWREVQREMDGMTAREQRWFGAQVAMAKVAISGKFNVLGLPSAIYNHAPQTRNDDLSRCKIVHYKGKRKILMLEIAREREWMTTS